MNTDMDNIQLAGYTTEELPLSWSKNLLVVDSTEHVWRLSHLSVVEYFEDRKPLLNREVPFHCDRVCVSFLIAAYGKFGDDSGEASIGSAEEPVNSGGTLDRNNPFYRYTKEHWPRHFRNNMADDHSKRILKRFLGSPSESSSYFQS
ncbi:hypothetical protein BDV26DRAFT_283480 [Aspergillus bertholletiae]|uniref:Uncharacterized protein n=1 Tax=Aspergillus bertholletiae TaxID=1226010 RepID=A0A5N7AZW3_9EURO|nr:hypothetical protein BDV26DRAFT_283480 [Aspergillus bertholletiae]